jgi:sulfotransferase
MKKNYYFLSGFFRSGNTVLSSILNQNPEIYSSPLSPLVDHLWESKIILETSEQSITNLENFERSKKIISSMIDTYYSDVNKKNIFDRHKVWINPDNISMLKNYISDNPKIIFTTRPILEMMASYIAISKNILIEGMNNSDFVQNKKLQINDNLADYLFSEHSNFGQNMRWAFYSIDNPENAGVIHLVKYQELLRAPQETMNSVYDFLEIDRFSHDFNNIVIKEKYNEDALNFPKDLHKVRKILGRSDVVVSDYLSDKTIDKYSNARYF